MSEEPKEIKTYRSCSVCKAIEVDGEAVLSGEDYDQDLLYRLGIHLTHTYLSDECVGKSFPGMKLKGGRKSCKGRTLGEIFSQEYSQVALSEKVGIFAKGNKRFVFKKEGDLYTLDRVISL